MPPVEALTAQEWAAHVAGPVDLPAVWAAWAQRQAVWLRGGPGTGKTQLLRAALAALSAGERGAPAGPWLVAAVDLSETAEPVSAVAAAVVAAAAQAGHLVEATAPQEWLAWWDRLNMAGKRTFGVGGIDVHAIKRKAPWGEIEVFPYQWTFGTLTNYLLLDAPLPADVSAAMNQVYGALAAGRSYFLNRRDGPCPALGFYAEQGGQRCEIGSNPRLRDGALAITADVGSAAELRLIGNGRLAARSNRAFRYDVREPGVYRLEASRKGRQWLFSNPIYVEE